MEVYFESLAEHSKAIAQGFFNLPKPSYNLALNNYNVATIIYMNLLPNKSHEKQLALFSNLIITSRKQNNFAGCVNIFNKVNSLLHATTHQHQKIWDKIYFNTAAAKCELAENLKKTAHYDKAILSILCEEINELKNCLSANSSEFAKNLSNRLNTLNNNGKVEGLNLNIAVARS